MAKLLPGFKQKIDTYELVPSDGGRFEVSLGGRLLYSKLETGRFPDEEEIVSTVQRELAGR